MAPTPAEIRQKMQQRWEACFQTYAERSIAQNSRAADRLLSLVPALPGNKVLDVATGPGVVALRAAQAVGVNGEVMATDLMPKWQSIVEQACQQAGLHNCQFLQMGAESLDFPDNVFDVVYCQFGLMFVPEPLRGLREMWRVLRPAGRMGIVVWSTISDVPCFQPPRLLNEILSIPLPIDDLPNPFALGAPGLIEELVEEAGFVDIVAERHNVETIIPDAEKYWQRLVQNADQRVTSTLAAMNSTEYERVHRQMLDFLNQFRQGDEIRLPNQAIFVSARKPI